jgi:hypothetical protein
MDENRYKIVIKLIKILIYIEFFIQIYIWT